jgi:outer membrane protein assembly factor BamB
LHAEVDEVDDAVFPTTIWEAPAVAPDGTAVYVWNGGDNRLYALSPANGKTLWSFNVGMTTYGSPTIGPDGTIYIGAQAGSKQYGNLYAIKPNGTLKWEWHGGIPYCWIETSAALGPHGTVYINHNCKDLVALTPTGTSAKVKWHRNVGEAWDSPSVGPDGTIYIGNSDFYFYAYHPDGKLKWRVPVRAWMYQSSSAISADGSAIYRGDNSGNFYDFSGSGHIRWRFQPADHGPVVQSS